jgi:hypothetical protein
MQFLSPIEAFNIIFLPYRKNLFYNSASKLINRIHTMSRIITAVGVAAFTLFVPMIAAVVTWKNPNFVWLLWRGDLLVGCGDI